MARKKKMDPLDIAAQQREREQAEVEQAFLKGMTTLRDLIAPSSLEIHSAYFRIAPNTAELCMSMVIRAGCIRAGYRD